MYVLPPVMNPLAPHVDHPSLPPIRFGVRGYLGLCLSIDRGLGQLESRYPAHPRMLTIEDRQQRLRRRRPK